MIYDILKSTDGAIRQVPQGTPRMAGEERIGFVRDKTPGELELPEPVILYNKKREGEKAKLLELAKKRGIGLGDLFAQLTKELGIRPCAKCKQRQLVMNKLRLDGWKIIKEKE